jgi:hypothetical protein
VGACRRDSRRTDQNPVGAWQVTQKPSKEFEARYSSAKRARAAEQPFLMEVLKFCCPGREHDFNRNSASYRADDTQVYISDAETLANDLASDLVTYFTPAEAKWASYLITMPIPEDQAEAVHDLVQDREDRLFDMIQTSNFNDIAKSIMFEAASHGTAAMWVEKGHIAQPIHVEPVPPNELFITPGHMGYLDRFRERSLMADTLPALFADMIRSGQVSLGDPKIKAKLTKPGSMVKVCWGFWLDWEDPGNPMWRCEITVDGMRVTPQSPLTLGSIAGSCPLLVGRFNPQINSPWGRGPGRTAIADLRVLDKIEELILTGMDQAVLPSVIYPNDGFLDLSEGIQSGRAYAAGRTFTRDQIFEMSRNVKVEYATDAKQMIIDRINKAFYQDGPRQRGDTPPSASQWLDERRRVQQRLGKPSAPLWTELFYPFVQRIEHLGVQAGKLPEAITQNGDVITVLPISPLQKAQNQDKVMVARSNLDLAFGVFQDQVTNFVDPLGTFTEIVRASGDELTKLRKKEITPNEGSAPPVQ